MDQQARKLGQGVNDARERLGDTLGALAEKADVSALQNSLAEKTEAARTSLDAGLSAVGNISANVSDRLPDPETVREGLRNPVVLTVGLLAAGILAGLIAPLSDAERRALRPIGSEVARRASDARDEVIDQSKAVLTETVAAARESAERHGQDLATNLGVTTSSSVEVHA